MPERLSTYYGLNGEWRRNTALHPPQVILTSDLLNSTCNSMYVDYLLGYREPRNIPLEEKLAVEKAASAAISILGERLDGGASMSTAALIKLANLSFLICAGYTAPAGWKKDRRILEIWRTASQIALRSNNDPAHVYQRFRQLMGDRLR